MKQCSGCKLLKPAGDFYSNKSAKDGLSYRCKTCTSKYYKDNKRVILDKSRQYRSTEQYQLFRRQYDSIREQGVEGKFRGMLRSARQRAKDKNIEFSLTIKDVRKMFATHCPITGEPLNWNTGSGFDPNSPSLDRSNPQKGYTADNVRIVSHKGNTWKNNMTLEDAIKVVNYLRSLSQ